MFEDILAQLRNPDEGVDYAALADSLETQATTVAQGYQATVEQKDKSIEEYIRQTGELKAHNYTLMMKQNTTDKSLTQNVQPPNESTMSGIKDLF